MKETVLFPRPTDWKLARLIQRDDSYVIQTRFNNEKLVFEQEIIIDIKTTPCPQLRAIILYCELYCEAICRKLRKRDDYRAWLEENRIQEEE